jgi:transcription initiation protein SPT3
MEYSECRQASFTYKKARKFREWLVGGTSRPASLTLSNLAGGSARDLARLSDDTLEILGFLAYEIVQKLTEVSLAVKYEREMLIINSNVNSTTSTPSLGDIFTSSNTANNNNNNSNISNNSNSSVKPSPATSSITVTSSNPSSTAHTHVKTPIQVNHVEEAYRKLIAGNLDSDNLFHHGSNRKRKFIL